MISRRQFLVGTGTMLLSERLARADDATSKIPISLTIDDGPTPYMKDIVDVLGDKGKATFFLVGRNMAENFSRMNGMELAKYAVERGHDLGNHSYNHPWFSDLTPEKAKEEIERTQELIEKAYAQCGKAAPLFFRFPFGDNGNTGYVPKLNQHHQGSMQLKQDLKDMLAGMGYSTYNWAVVDYSPNSPFMKSGAVVLTHDWTNKLGVLVSKDYLALGGFELLSLPITAASQYEVKII
ncbi:MAG: polysaccharide deacetylase family protein [Nanoarchaeota archaeon]